MNVIRRFLCNKLDWHKPTKLSVGLEIIEWYCEYCYRVLLRDSKGKWVSVQKKGGSNE
jgi:hypothetical protein